MILNIYEPIGKTTSRWIPFRKDETKYALKRHLGATNSTKRTLGEILNSQKDSIEKLYVNGCTYSVAEWEEYVPEKGDVIDVYVPVGGPIIQIIISLVMMAISIALTPTPKKPKATKLEESFGISGITNTTGPGTPKFVIYGGPLRIYPHLIGTRVDLGDKDKAGGSKRLKFSALYFCGDTGGDSYEEMSDVEINGTKIADIDGMTYETRLGTDAQTVIEGFNSAAQTFSAGLTLAEDIGVTYTTKLTDVNRITLIFQQTLFTMSSEGKLGAGVADIKIELKKNSEPVGSYVVLINPFRVIGAWQAPTYYSYVIDTPTPDQYDIRLTQTRFLSSVSTDPILYNVQEEVFTSRNYPGSALLAVYGVSSNQVNSFESIKASVVIKGKRVKRPLIGGGTELMWTTQRMWIAWDIITHPKVGMGHRVPESFFDTGSAGIEQAYLDETVLGQNGNEVRDECTILLNDRKAGWDWIKDSIFGEVNGILFLSGGKLKPALKRPKTPNLMYSYPGNILEDKGGAVKRAIARINSSPFNTLRVTLQNRDADYSADVIEVKDVDIGSDPVRDDNMQFDTIKRVSQAFRQAQIILRENLLVRRRYSFRCGMTAQVSEPFDIDTLVMRSLKDKGQAGYCTEGSTTTSLVMDKSIELDGVSTYQIMVRHQNNNVVERRIVSESNGKYFILTPTVNFATAPADGDLYAVARSGVELVDVVIQDIRRSDKDYEISVSEYIPAVWSDLPLPPKSARRFFNLGTYPPLQLRSVSIIEDLGLNSSGVFESVLNFDVVPGIPVISNLVRLPAGQLEPIDGVYLSLQEPANDDYYNRWILKIVDGPGSGQPEVTITDYDGLTRKASCDLSAWIQLPTVGSTYEVRRERYGAYAGFYVEQADDPAGPWYEPGGSRFIGNTGRLSGPSLTTTFYYRFTPFSNQSVESLLGRFVVQFTAQGDLGVPGDVQDFNAIQMGPRILFTWHKNADVDIDHYQIRIGNPVANTWDMAMLLADQLAGPSYETESIAGIILPPVPPPPPPPPIYPPIIVTGPLPPGLNAPSSSPPGVNMPSEAYSVTNPGPPLIAFIKAVDKSGNMSVNAASVAFDMLPVSDIIELARRDELLEPTGAFNGTAYRAIDGTPYLALAASAKWDTGLFWDGVTVWDTPTGTAGEYSALPLVLTRQGVARSRIEISSPNFNQASYVIQESHSVDGVSYTPYKTLTTGDLRMRAAKLKILLSAESNIVDPMLDRVQSVIEARVRTVLRSNLFIPASGITMLHDPPWLKIPLVHITSYSGHEAIITLNTETALQFRIGTPGVDTFASVSLIGV